MSENATRWRRREILGVTMTEIMLLLVFVLLIVVEVTASNLEATTLDLEKADAQLDRLRMGAPPPSELNGDMKQALARLMMDVNDPPEFWDRLVHLERLDEKLGKMTPALRKLGIDVDEQPENWTQLVHLDELTKSQRKIEDAFEKKKREAEELAAEVAGLLKKVASLRRSLEEEREAEQGELSTRLAVAQNEIADLMRRLGEAETELAAATKTAKAVTTERNEVEQRLATGREALEAAESRIANLNQQIVEQEEAKRCQGGYDRAPCWPGRKEGKKKKKRSDYLLTIEMGDTGFLIAPAWPDWRAAQAKELGLSVSSVTEYLTPPQFKKKYRRIFNAGVRNECGYYVRVHDKTSNKKIYVKRLEQIEGFFY